MYSIVDYDEKCDSETFSETVCALQIFCHTKFRFQSFYFNFFKYFTLNNNSFNHEFLGKYFGIKISDFYHSTI